jgi:hypothetical protein
VPAIIKQFGLQRSGTNYTAALIRINYKNILLDNFTETINKHAVPQPSMLTKWDHVIVNHKDPLAWYVSYCKFFPEVGAWPGCKTVLWELWFSYYSALSTIKLLNPDKVTFINYTDLLNNSKACLSCLAKCSGERPDPWQDIHKRVGPEAPDGTIDINDSDFLPEYYHGRHYMREIPDKVLDRFRWFVGTYKPLLHEMGYRYPELS